jgi:hypothetical protein
MYIFALQQFKVVRCFYFYICVDVIGFLTGISTAREYIKDGKITKICMLELNDAR